MRSRWSIHASGQRESNAVRSIETPGEQVPGSMTLQQLVEQRNPTARSLASRAMSGSVDIGDARTGEVEDGMDEHCRHRRRSDGATGDGERLPSREHRLRPAACSSAANPWIA
jgi:hypothetical protein